MTVEPPARKPSLVDSAEQALRNWLAPGRHRPGDRLPPEHDLAAMLGVSRGTLRTALQRLEQTGEIVRRQGSGTFVGRMADVAAFHEGLERLVSYSALARARGVKLGVRDLRIERRPLDGELARVFAVEPSREATVIERLVTVDGELAAQMVDTVSPTMPLPSDARLRQAMERGRMVLDVMVAQAIPIAFANTSIRPRLLAAREPAAKALGIARATAVLELEETYYLASGEITHHSRDLFAPRGLDLHVVRSMDADIPAVSGDNGSPERPGRRRPPR